MKLYSIETIRYLKDKYGFKLSKSLGQNFMIDIHKLQTMVEASGATEKDLVIEIGPGIGSLTGRAAEAAAHVTAIEIDEGLKPILAETLGGKGNVDLVFADVLDIDLKELIEEKKREFDIEGEVRIIGNLPYYITTPIVMKLLEEDLGARSITIMTQKEVADRMGAGPGGKEYGALSIMVQYHCRVEQVARVPKDCFYPAPKVDSAIVNFTLLDEKPVEVDDEKVFFDCIRAGFGQRRKTLLNSLSAGLAKPKDQTRTILEEVGIDPRRRAETLTIEEFANMANAITRG